MKRRLLTGCAILLAVQLLSALVAAEENLVGEAVLEMSDSVKVDGANVAAARAEDAETGATLDGVVEVTFDDATTKLIAGAIGAIEWETDGDGIVGTIKGPAGQEIAVLNGQIENGGMSGTFTDSAGRKGKWVWHGELPSM